MTLSVFDAARTEGDGLALIAEGEHLTWAELAERAALALDELIDRGLRPGSDEPVALIADPSLDTLIRLYALMAAGLTVHLVHPSLTTAERQSLFDRIRPIETPASRPPGHADPLPGPKRPEDVDARDERAMAVVYTSGTSGTPKGVVLSRRAIVASAGASEANLGWRDDDRWLLRIPIAHIGGLSTVTRCLLARRCLVLADEASDGGRRADDPSAPGAPPLLEQIERDRITIVSLVPTLLRRLLDDAPGRRPPAHLRAVLLGGALPPRDLLAEAADSGWPVLTTYGLSEAGSQVTTQVAGTVNRGELGSGRALPGVDVRVVDDEIQVRGRILFTDYFPAAVASPFLDDGYFATGDRGRLDDEGNLHVLGRGDDLIVTGGENVDPLEVEEALRACDEVADACVFGVPDREWGERVAALIVPSGTARDVEPIDAALRVRLAPFKLPRAVAFVERLPVNRSGKVDRAEAATRFRASLVPVTRAEPHS